jgi:hypothetical protein
VADLLYPLWVDLGDGNGPIQNPDITQEQFDAGLAQMQADNVQALWQAATSYVEAQISGAAYGLVTLGVVKGAAACPKCAAVMAWINSVWAIYYTRKPQVTYTWNEALLDFSSCGPMPHAVPELLAEVMG